MYKTHIVNKENPLKESFLKRIELVNGTNIQNEIILIEKNTYEAYQELENFLKTKEIIIGIEKAYEKEITKDEEIEHQTGLAIDLSVMINKKWYKNNKELMDCKNYYKEIHKYLHDFGFILRYPKEKEHITGYPYEPLHIRYVGKVISKIIYENDFTLEEYKENFSGVIAVNKEKGMTSFDVVNDISHIFGIKKVGHTGTLDPLAEGVLLVAIGKATKIVELLTAADKEYVADVKLGIKTDTYDITGEVIETKEVPKNLNIKEVLESYQKTYNQEVPIYSAIKVNGKKLYEYARKNQEIELPKKEVTIKEIELLDATVDTFKFRSLVSKGTYIRSLINDIGNSLNTYATMTTLLRTKQGTISLENTYKVEDIKNNNYKIKGVSEVLDYPVITVDSSLEFKISNGQKLENTWNITDKVIFETTNKQLLGIYKSENNTLKVWKNFT